MLLNFEASCSDENRLAAMAIKLCDELQQDDDMIATDGLAVPTVRRPANDIYVYLLRIKTLRST